MSMSTTMTIRVSADIKEKLDRVADHTRRSRSFLAGEAVAAYVERELEIIEGIEQGRADAAAGNVTSHDDAIAMIRQAVLDASKGKAARR